jgi:hypothetical protein
MRDHSIGIALLASSVLATASSAFAAGAAAQS